MGKTFIGWWLTLIVKIVNGKGVMVLVVVVMRGLISNGDFV